MIALLEIWVNIGALAMVCASCVLHLNANVDKASPECEAWGFILTAAGSFGLGLGQLLSIWWPNVDFKTPHLATLMHIGMMLIALWLVHGKLRAWLGTIPGARWVDRRRT